MDFIPLSSPDIRQEDLDAVCAVLKSGMLVQGVNVEKFESNVSAYLGSAHAVAVANGTATMHMALKALGVGPGDEVIVPAFSYVATANVVELTGALPVFVDIDPDTFNIDVNQVSSRINPRTKAIIPVHEFGLPCDIVAIMDIANRHSLYVIEDAACALGATQNNTHVGTFGHFGSFSLHPRKAISSGEGGVITTQDEALAKKVRILRNHGIDMTSGQMEFVEAGFNYRMTDFQAALVNSQFQRFNAILSRKSELAEIYLNSISNGKVKLPTVPPDRTHTWQSFHVLVDESLNRDDILQDLRNKGIGVNYGAQCIPDQKYYKAKYGLDSAALFPNALKAYRQGIVLPLYEKLEDTQIKYIAEQINRIT